MIFLVICSGCSFESQKGITITSTCHKCLKESNQIPNKIWVDKGSEFYNNFVKKKLEDNDIEMYSIHNEEKSVLAVRSIKTLRTKIYKYMDSISKKRVYR